MKKKSKKSKNLKRSNDPIPVKEKKFKNPEPTKNKRAPKKARSRKPKAPKTSFTKGMSTQDILNIDLATFNKLNTQEMREMVQRLSSTANKRMKALRESGLDSPALRAVNRSRRGKFSTRGKNLNELRAEFVRAKNFLENKTSTVSGWKKVRNEIIESLQEEGINITISNFDNLWKAFNKLAEGNPLYFEKNYRYEVLRELKEEMENYDNTEVDEVVAAIQNRMDKLYEQVIANDEDTGVSQFFEIE